MNGSYAPTQVDDNGDGVMDRWAGGDPCVGKIMEFRVHAYAGQDLSMNPALYTPGGQKMIPLHRPSAAEIAAAKHHEFVFGRSGGTDALPWTIKTDGGDGLIADYKVVSVAPQLGELQVGDRDVEARQQPQRRRERDERHAEAERTHVALAGTRGEREQQRADERRDDREGDRTHQRTTIPTASASSSATATIMTVT